MGPAHSPKRDSSNHLQVSIATTLNSSSPPKPQTPQQKPISPLSPPSPELKNPCAPTNRPAGLPELIPYTLLVPGLKLGGSRIRLWGLGVAVPAFSFKAAGSLIRSFGILRFLSLSAQSLGAPQFAGSGPGAEEFRCCFSCWRFAQGSGFTPPDYDTCICDVCRN